MIESIVFMLGLGIVCAAILTAASRIFYVYEDPRIARVEAAFAGANCGGCGYAGCSAAAVAVVAGEAEPSVCVVGGPESAAKAAEVMGVEVGLAEPPKSYNTCSGGKRAADKFIYLGVNTCRAQAALSGGQRECSVGCIGLGGMGRGDMGAHRRFGDVVALCDVDTGQIAAAKGRNDGKGDEYTDYRQVLERDDIDVISCVTTDHWHTKICIEALEAGKHVFCEWPLGANLAEAQEMAALARAKGVVTAVGLQGRQDPALTYVRELHEEGWLGDVLSVNLTMFGSGAGRSARTDSQWFPWRAAGQRSRAGQP